MMHPDGTPYWEPTPLKANAQAQIDYSLSTGEAFSKGGTYLGEYPSLTACGEAHTDTMINCIY